MTVEVKILLVFLFGLLSDAFNFDSSEEESSGYNMLIKHEPWWRYDFGNDDLGSSFQYFYPFFEDNKDPTSFQWHLSPIKAPAPPSQPIQPSQPSQSSSSSTREWPSWLPPIRLIKLPLDEPPID